MSILVTDHMVWFSFMFVGNLISCPSSFLRNLSLPEQRLLRSRCLTQQISNSYTCHPRWALVVRPVKQAWVMTPPSLSIWTKDVDIVRVSSYCFHFLRKCGKRHQSLNKAIFSGRYRKKTNKWSLASFPGSLWRFTSRSRQVYWRQGNPMMPMTKWRTRLTAQPRLVGRTSNYCSHYHVTFCQVRSPCWF